MNGVRPTWLFEADVFGETAEPIKAEIRRQGMACIVSRESLLRAKAFPCVDGRRLGPESCVLACGSIPFVQFVQQGLGWRPGGWCNPATLACSCYYSKYGPYLLNQPHRILTAADAVAQRDDLFAELACGGRVFVRPEGCHKLFTGRVVSREEFTQATAPARYDPATRIVVAPARIIAREWRLIVAEGEVVSGSQYARLGKIEIRPDVDSDVLAFAQGMLADTSWRPDAIFMLDVCESEGRLFLLELNSFSCSAWYACDLKKVVARASDLAVRTWVPLVAN